MTPKPHTHKPTFKSVQPTLITASHISFVFFFLYLLTNHTSSLRWIWWSRAATDCWRQFLELSARFSHIESNHPDVRPNHFVCARNTNIFTIHTQKRVACIFSYQCQDRCYHNYTQSARLSSTRIALAAGRNNRTHCLRYSRRARKETV